MSAYIKPLEVRWSDLDPNFHLRHSVYYDFGAYVRILFLSDHGISPAFMAKNHFGPILFREECVFKKEIRMGDVITIDVQLLKSRPDYSRYTFQHNIKKNGDEIAAILTIDGAWMDVLQRKLMVPAETLKDIFDNMPKAEQFTWDK